MDRAVAWVGKLVGTALGGPGVAVLGDPGLSEVTGDGGPSYWTYRLIGLAGALTLFVVVGAPLPVVGAIGVAAIAVLGIAWLRRNR